MLNALRTTAGAGVIAAAVSFGAASAAQAGGPLSPAFEISQQNTALLVAGPENTSLNPGRFAWGIVDRNFEPRETTANIDKLFVAATVSGIPIFVSQHYFIPKDQDLEFGATMETLAPKISLFDQNGYHSVDGFKRTGPNWLAQIRKSIEGGETAPDGAGDVHWPKSTHLTQQLRAHGIEEVIIAGVFATRSTAAQIRELVAQGFSVLVVSDATADGIRPGSGVYRTVFGKAASTDTIVTTMQNAAGM